MSEAAAPAGDSAGAGPSIAISEADRARPLIFQRRFLPMWAALCLGAFTDNMLKQALSVGLTYGYLTAPFISNDSALPIVGFVFPVSMLLFSTIAGQFADKYETSLMFRRTKLVEFILMAIAGVGFLLGNAGLLILILFLMGAQSAFFSPTRTGAMPKYLATDELVRGNAICSGGLFVSVMIGIVFGALLIAQASGRSFVSIVLFVAALAGWLAIRFAPPARANAPDLVIKWNVVHQARELFGFAVNARGVLRPILGVTLYWTVGALISVTVPLYGRDVLHADPSVVALLMALFAVGAAIGAGVASTVSKGRSGLGFSAFGSLTAGVLSLFVVAASLGVAAPSDGALYSAGDFLSTPRGWIICLLFLIASASSSVFVVPLQAATQRRAPSDKRSRILAANNMLNALGAGAGSLSVLLVTNTALSPYVMFLISGALQVLIAVYMLRRKRMVPDGLYDEILTAPGPAADNLAQDAKP